MCVIKSCHDVTSFNDECRYYAALYLLLLHVNDRDKKNKAAKEKLMDYHAKEAAKAQVSFCARSPHRQ